MFTVSLTDALGGFIIVEIIFLLSQCDTTLCDIEDVL